MTTTNATTTNATTTNSWWQATKADPQKLAAWLIDQLRGEATAAGRIRLLRDRFAGDDSARRVLSVIADQEETHATWVKELLAVRGLPTVVVDEPERYWQAPLAGIADFATGCAVGAHAERMRLERIEAIANDVDAADDIRAVFAKILPQERFHERAFRLLAGPDALERTRAAHELGRAALGLAP